MGQETRHQTTAARHGDFEESLEAYATHEAEYLLVMCSKGRGFIVYLDDKRDIWWATNNDFMEELVRATSEPGPERDACDRFWVRYNLMADRSVRHLPPAVRETFRLNVAGALAAFFGEQRAAPALAILDEAQAYINEREREQSRLWYLSGSAVVAGVTLFATSVLWLCHYSLANTRADPASWGGLTFLWLLMASGCGALGAAFSVLQRVGSSPLNPSAGPSLHRVEGGVRVLVGMMGAVLVALAVRAGLVGPPTSSDGQAFRILCVLSVIAGTSERLVNTLIQKTTDNTFAGSATDRRQSSPEGRATLEAAGGRS